MQRPAFLRRVSGLSAWVLWLALLLPLAQLGAAVHGYTHLQDPARTGSDKHLPAACEACVTAAAIGAGAAPATVSSAPPVLAPEHAAPRYFAADAAPSAAATPYQSRAPPFLPA